MPNGSPPSSRPYLSEEPLLVEARGTLRDALGALGNLDQLLHSLKVGPKALSTVLPDVRDSCAPAQNAVKRLLLAARENSGDSQAIIELEHSFRPRLDELYESISRAASTQMHARDRLKLERVVTRVFPELEAARALLDLVEEALAAPPMRLKLRELLDQVSLEPAEGQEVVGLRVLGDLDSVELLVQPQVTLSLLKLGTSLLAEQAGNTPLLRVQRGPGDGCSLHFETEATDGEQFLVPKQTVIPPTEVCVDEAVTRMGCKVSRKQPGGAFSVAWA